MLRYENVLGGLLVTDDGGKTVRILPGTSFTRSGLRGAPPVLMVADGTVLMGGGEGLLKADQHGCDAGALAGDAATSAIARHPSEPGTAFFATTSSSDANVRTGLWQRSAAGELLPLGPDNKADPSGYFYVSGLQVVTLSSAQQQLRFVETGIRLASSSPGDADAGVSSDAGTSGDGAVRSGGSRSTSYLRFSDDLGQTWTEHVIPSALSSDATQLLAVDPLDPQRMLVALTVDDSTLQPNLVLLTVDGGATFRSYIEGVSRVGQVAVASDGRLWLGDMGNTSSAAASGGLWFVRRLGEAPEQVVTGEGITCVAHDASSDKLWLCHEYDLELFDPSTRSACRIFDMSDVVGFVSCPKQDLRKSLSVTDQLCSGYCGALHFADAPLCSVYNDPTRLCGLPALDYDQHVGWTSVIADAPRCAGFPPPSVALDAGVQSMPPPSLDAGLVIPVEPPASASDGGMPPSTRKNDGGGCTLSAGVAGAAGPHGALSLFGGLLLGWVASRRRRTR